MVRIGLLGLGTVGQAVARLARGLDSAQTRGLELRIEGALVRDVTRPRRCQPPSRVTTNPSAFLRGHYDIVIEALGGLEPARTLVARVLGRGIPVVTANKTLIATAGQELQALAADRGTSLRYEASALAGVPFLGALAARPLVSAIDRFAAVLNGTSNFILSALEKGSGFEHALELAARRGLTEADPSRDLDGLDAADKLALLCGLCRLGNVAPSAIETTSIRHVTSTDTRAARSLGGALKLVAVASRTAHGLDAFVGPAFVSARSPLATLTGTLNGIELHGHYVRDLFFSGPGAGPDVTAATLLDDCIETVKTSTSVPVAVQASDADDARDDSEARPRRFFLRPSGACVPPRSWTHVGGNGERHAGIAPRPVGRRSSFVSAPVTPWLLRVAFPGIVPTPAVLVETCSQHGLSVEHVTDPIDNARCVLVNAAEKRVVDATLDTLRRQHRTLSAAFRRVADDRD